MNTHQFWLRTTGISGVLGGMILFIGDLLFYYHPRNDNLLQNMAHISDFRIIASGIAALLATWLYLAGVIHLYYALKPSHPALRNIIVLCFAGIFVIYGIVHAEYIAIATTAKMSIQNQLNLPENTALAIQTNNILRLFAYPIFALLSYLFIKQVWKRKTLYPKWIILFFPLIPFLLRNFVDKILSGKIWVIIMGGYLNLILIIFFLASTIALWNIDNKHN